MMEVNDRIRAKAAALPTGPGVYQWKDRSGKVIYVGKAVNLRNRVRSYIRTDKNRSPKVAAMIRHAEDLDITLTQTEMEALILECNLIKELHPRYNISLRDDKTYPYVKITMADEWPRITVTRSIQRNDGSRSFGPFTDVGSLRSMLKLLRRYYPIRTCRNMNVPRPCLQYHLHLCCAPCAGLCSHEEYADMVKKICELFDGRSADMIRDLTEQMTKASEAMEYERAAVLRDRIQAVRSVQQRQNVVANEGDFDAVGLARSDSQACVQIFYVRYGRMVGKENFNIPDSGSVSDKELISAFLKQFYGEDTVYIPGEIILPVLPEDAELFSTWLSARKKAEVRIYVPERGFKRSIKDMAASNAEKYLADRKLQWEYRAAREEGAVQKLAEILHLPDLPERIECFDISHIQGAETTASMSVFEHGVPAKKEYRKFKLETTQGKPDDFKSMAEIMARRYGREKDWPVPDLIVIDGGKGQLHAALPIIRSCGVTAPVIGLAKRIEEIFTENRDDSIILDHHEPALQLLQHIRDEAHRFGITFHRQWTAKRNTESILDHIHGIGPARRTALWHAFRSLDEMRGAGMEELSAVPGMNRAAARQVYEFFRMGKEEKKEILSGRNKS